MTFDASIALAVKLAGDTDTNACIVGGMMGALYGRQGLPYEKVQVCLKCNLGKGTKPSRPAKVQPAKCFESQFDIMWSKLPEASIKINGSI